MATKDTNSKLKKATGLVSAITHARAKASAAMHGMELQEWVGEAIEEKLAREEKRLVQFPKERQG